MNILLTGATGYIGGSVLRAAAARGLTVTRLVRPGRPAGPGTITADLADLPALRAAAARADAVIHAAASDDPAFAPVNAAAIGALLDGLGRRGAFAMQGGSMVFGDTGPEPVMPDAFAPPPPLAGRATLDQGVLDRADGVATSIVYGSLIYGHGGGAIPSVMAAAASRLGHVAVPGTGAQVWSVAHVDDVGALMVDAALAGASGPLFPAAAHLSMSDIAGGLAHAMGIAAEPADPEAATQAYGFFGAALALNQSFRADTARATGWQPAHPTPAPSELFEAIIMWSSGSGQARASRGLGRP